jgi:hypothetical protein
MVGWVNCMIKTSGWCGASLVPEDEIRLPVCGEVGRRLIFSVAGFQNEFKIGGTWRKHE